MFMLIAQTDPVAVLAISAVILAFTVGHVWFFLVLHRSHKIGLRTLETVTENSIAIARLEQAVQAANPSTADMRSVASAAAKGIRSKNLNIESLLADTGVDPARNDPQNART
jgi:hypothetical protein